MTLEVAPSASPFSRWTSRVALFSMLLVATTAILHKLFGLPTPVAFNILKLAILGAILSLVLGLLAAAGIWRSGGSGAARVVVGVVVSLSLLALPLMVAAMSRDYPNINDVTTDINDAPRFEELAKLRGPAANNAQYPGGRFAKEQARAYPDLAPLHINRSVKEAFEVVADAVKRQHLTVVKEKAPGGPDDPGLIEAVDRTLVLGFYDDVAVRVTGGETSARVDIRSASRYGRNDLGQNADRTRALLKEIVVRLEETVPTAAEVAGEKKDGEKKGRPVSKKGDDPKSERRRRLRDRALSSAPREQAPKAKPPAKGFDQVPGIQPGRSFE